MQRVNPAAGQRPATVLTKAVMRASDLLGLKDADLALVIGASSATIARYKLGTSEIDPDSAIGNLALPLVRLFRSLESLVGSDGEKRKAWIHTPNEALGDEPAALICKADGLSRTLAYLLEQTVVLANPDAYAAFLARLDAPVKVVARLRKTMQTSAPWD